ncbi:hypothetical protein QUF80_04625 [Desulfococcaceae bacterium HSG8]|nr:hypothetical protein [Desulfococcaceae bacterium HSG8]
MSIRTERERAIHVARGGLANPPPRGSDLSIRTERERAIRAADDPCCSRGIGKSPAGVRICQSEPSGRRPSERQRAIRATDDPMLLARD